MESRIIFGTDGWRGYIAEDFTFENVRRCSQGFATYMLKQGKKGDWFIVGYDKRFHSENFARVAAEVLVGNGMNVYLTMEATPTPVIAYSVLSKKASGAINITASHNPPTLKG
jgi:phosphomannomutase